MPVSLSIIIPIYNSALFLEECLDSIKKQTYKDFECILVDDGSTDQSAQICDSYSEKDSRFKTFHKKNGGVSSARNFGLEKASGKWIGFVDSDDWIDLCTYEKVLSIAEEKKVEQLQWGICIENKNKIVRTYKEGFFTINDEVYFEPSMCHKIVLRSVIKSNNISFPEKIALSEDRLFSFLCYIHSHVNYAISDVFYHYRQNVESASHNMSYENILEEVTTIKTMEKLSSNKQLEVSKFIQKQKFLVKNHCLTLLKKPECKYWRTIFPEINKFSIILKEKKFVLYILLLLHIDFPVLFLMKIYKARNKQN